MLNSIEGNIQAIQKCINRTCQRVGRGSHGVQIIPATKTVNPEHIKEASQCGLSIFAENRVQEAQRKIKKMGEAASQLDWHFIG